MGKAPRKVASKNTWGQKAKRSKYMTRSDAMKYLQLNLGDFRRLCILKGIHPKQPTKSQLKNRSKLNKDKPLQKGKLYYYKKDIKFMAHDPLVIRFREWKLFLKRLKKAEVKQDADQIKSLNEYSKPHFTYDHLVKERYPTFQAALNDLDDCLTLMFMFNHLPSGYGGIEPQQLQLVKRLCDEFCTYVAKKRLLRKSFLSFKGIYYQAEIWGQKITWVVPYGYTQTIPQEADFKIFKTFLTFYTTLMTFVNYKLYHDDSTPYPPTVDYTPSLKSFIIPQLLETSQSGSATTQKSQPTAEEKKKHEKAQQEISNLLKKSTKKDNEDVEADVITAVQTADAEIRQPETAEEMFFEKFKNLFKNMTFYISRECPIAALEFVLKAFGGKTTTDEAEAKNGRITHYILDRPAIPATLKSDSCEFVQPQWVFDCVNAKIFIPLEKYRPGEKLPPHLSPFEEDIQKQLKYVSEDTTYEPVYAKELRRMVESELASLRRLQKRRGGTGTEDDRGVLNSVALGIDVPEVVYSDDEEEEDVRLEEDDDSEQEEDTYAREIEMEKTGMKFNDFQKQLQQEKKQKEIRAIKSGVLPKTKKQLKEEEEILLKKTMMSRNKVKLYEHEVKKMKKAKSKAIALERRRVELEEQQRPSEEVTVRDAVDSDDEDADQYEQSFKVKQTEENKKQPVKSEKKAMDMDEDDDFDLSQFEPVEDSDDEVLDIAEEEEEKPVKKSQPKKQQQPAQGKKEQKNKSQEKKQKATQAEPKKQDQKSKKRPAPTKQKPQNKKMKLK